MKQGRRELAESTSEIHLRYSQFSNTAAQKSGGLAGFFGMQNNLRALEKQMHERNSGSNYTGIHGSYRSSALSNAFSILTGASHLPPTVSRGTAFVAGEASVPTQPQQAWPDASEHEAQYQYFYLKYDILRLKIEWFSFRPSVS